MDDLFDLIHERHSERAPYDPRLRLGPRQLEAILDSAAWAPTAHNMQNFQVLVVDDPGQLTAVGQIVSRPDPVFLRENAAQLAASEAELMRRGAGMIAEPFPEAWRRPDGDFEALAAAAAPTPLADSLKGSPCLILVLYDPLHRAPASEGDRLGLISLGCVMENMWLTAQSLGVGFQILSLFSTHPVEAELRRLLGFPERLEIAYACRLGYPIASEGYTRVRRPLGDFVHLNRYGRRGLG